MKWCENIFISLLVNLLSSRSYCPKEINTITLQKQIEIHIYYKKLQVKFVFFDYYMK